MRTRLVLAAFAALLALAGPSAAQEAEGGAPAEGTTETTLIPPAHLALAQEIITLTKADETFDEILPRLAEQTQTVLIRQYPSFTREIEETVPQVALTLAARRAELAQVIQSVWARRFTVEELTELRAFFSSDLGRKFVNETPVITALSIGAARQWEQALSQQLLEEARTQLRAKGVPL
jgi:hypothetical protein